MQYYYYRLLHDMPTAITDVEVWLILVYQLIIYRTPTRFAQFEKFFHDFFFFSHHRLLLLIGFSFFGRKLIITTALSI